MSYKSICTKSKRSRSTKDIIDNTTSNRSQICNISKIDLITRNNSSNMCNGNNSNQTTANKNYIYYNHIPKNKRSRRGSCF